MSHLTHFYPDEFFMSKCRSKLPRQFRPDLWRFLCLNALPFIYKRLCKQLECYICRHRIAGDSEHWFTLHPSEDDRLSRLDINPMEYYLSEIPYRPCRNVLGTPRRTCIDNN